MEKVENQEKNENDIKTPLKNMISELKALNEMYADLFEEAVGRGIKDSFDATKNWSEEKINEAQVKIEEIGKTVSKNVVKAGQKVKNAGKIALGLGILGVGLTIKGAKSLRNKVYKPAKESIKRFARNKANGFQGYVKGKVDDISQNLDEDIAQKNSERIKSAVGNVSSKAEDIGSIKTVANAAKALGTVGRVRTIKGVKAVGKGIKQKFVDANNAILGFQMGAKKELRKKAKEVKQNASDYMSYKKREIDAIVSDSKEYIDYAKAEVEGKVEDIKTGISNKWKEAKKYVTDKKDSIIETKNQVKSDALDAAYRFKQRKNTTLSSVLNSGGKIAKELLETIGTAMQSKQEQLELNNQEIAKKREQNKSRDTQTMEQ